ncbi:hypothetical protein B0T14DRAFT_564099 [Immersiella caudata]|uniref:Peptidase M12A domain-containing protein n=1 Tax=Immersiella caudata TaxID=314043 RepID=A0AA40C2Q4_9PEZI|nr:hypothetical protein B0T14DRAFT_564099 [Immersiella caudata]
MPVDNHPTAASQSAFRSRRAAARTSRIWPKDMLALHFFFANGTDAQKNTVRKYILGRNYDDTWNGTRPKDIVFPLPGKYHDVWGAFMGIPWVEVFSDKGKGASEAQVRIRFNTGSDWRSDYVSGPTSEPGHHHFVVYMDLTSKQGMAEYESKPKGQALSEETKINIEKENRGLILHELGHVLGLIHEHQRPDLKVPWRAEEDVKRWYNTYWGWDPNNVKPNITSSIDPVDIDLVHATVYDPESIMHYVVPRDVLCQNIEDSKVSERDPHWVKYVLKQPVPKQNTELSVKDKEWVAATYPRKDSA